MHFQNRFNISKNFEKCQHCFSVYLEKFLLFYFFESANFIHRREGERNTNNSREELKETTTEETKSKTKIMRPTYTTW